MAKTNQTVQVKDATSKVTIEMDGPFILGGNDTNGDVRLREDRGETVISMSARTGNIVAGGHGKDGDIVLLDEKSKARWIMEAFDASLEAKNEAGEITFRIDGQTSDIFLSQIVPPTPKTVALDDLEAIGEFYAEFKHLPEMPSREELEKGISLKDFTLHLLGKVEEMTQYIVLMERMIRDMNAGV